MLEALVLSHPAVAHCHFIPAKQTLYFVLKSPVSESRLKALVREQAPELELPKDWVRVSHLPMTHDGLVDEEVLAQLPVLDERTMTEYQQSLSAHKDVKAAMVLRKEVRPTLGRLHLANLLPDFQTEIEPTEAPDAAAASTPLAEQGQLAYQHGGPLVMPTGAPRTLTAAFLETAVVKAEKGITVISSQGASDFLAYGVLLEEAKAVLKGLQEQGIRPGRQVILQVGDPRAHFVALWACILGGLVPVTVALAPVFDKSLALVNKLFHTASLLDKPLFLCRAERHETLRAFIAAEVPGLESFALEDLARSGEPEIFHPVPEDLLFIQLTSGSTGLPKAIQITHRGVVAHIWGASLWNGYSPEDVTLNWLPFDHVVPTLTFHFKDCYLGIHQVHVATDLILAEPLQWLDLIEKYKVTHTWSPNFGFKLVTKALAHHRTDRHDLSSMVSFMNAGESVTVPVMEEFLERTRPYGVRPKMIQPAFGMAEACTCMTWCRDFDLASSVCSVAKDSLGGTLMQGQGVSASRFVCLGPPVAGVEIRIADAQNRTLPEGVIGYFQIKGDVITPGYYRNETANQEAFVGDGWFNSGDLGFMHRGALYLTGRLKETIIVRGTNFYCYEIEDVVNGCPGAVPGFSAAVAFRSSHKETEGVALFVVPESREPAALAAFCTSVRAQLAMNLGITPDLILPLSRETFPKTTSGKIQRVSLRNQLEAGHFNQLIQEMDLLLENRNTLPNWFFQRTLKPMALRQPNPLSGSTLLVSSNRPDLETVLKALGADTVWLEPGTSVERLGANHFRGASSEHMGELLQTLSQEGVTLSRCVFWVDETSADFSGSNEAETVNRWVALVQALANCVASGQRVRMIVLTSELFPDPSSDTQNWVGSSLLGLVRVAPNEMPWLDCRLVDVAKGHVDGQILEQELAHLSTDRTVVWRQGRRWVSRLEPAELKPKQATAVVKEGGFYLITGGLGGVGQTLCTFLMEYYKANLLVVGRTPIAGRQTSLDALADLDGRVLYRSLDLCDEERLQAAVTEASETYGRALDGVFHLAGVFPFTQLVDETEENIGHVLAPKVRGTLALHRLLQDRKDALFVAFSSAAAHFGFMMSGVYCAANTFVDHFMAWRRHAYPHSLAVVWGIWDDLGMNRGNHTNSRLEARGLIPIQPRLGMLSLMSALQNQESGILIGLDSGRAEVRAEATGGVAPLEVLEAWLEAEQVPPDLPAFVDACGRSAEVVFHCCKALPRTLQGEVDIERLHAPDVGEAAHDAPGNAEQILQEIWRGVLGLDRVGLTQNFFDLGGNSLLMSQVGFQTQKRLGMVLDPVILYRYPTIRSLAAFLRGASSQPTQVTRSAVPISEQDPSIAIIGMAGRFPGAANLEQFWQNLIHGRESITWFSEQELRDQGVDEGLIQDPNYIRAAPILEDVAQFAAAFFNISAREAMYLDPQQRLFIELAWQTLEQGGYNPYDYPGLIGVYAGATLNTYGLYLAPTPAIDMRFIADQVDTDREFIATRTAYKFNLRGPAVNVQTACSTSLVAVHMACQALLSGDADMALAGATSIRVPHRVGYYYEEGSIFSPDGHCRPFDSGGKGTLFGNGGGVVLLKPLSRALADRDTVYAVIRGTAINNDGSLKAGFTAPRVDGQVAVIRSALQRAGVAPESVSYVEAHGTGTTLGDPIELTALNEAYGPGHGPGSRTVGSVKGNIGHLDAASGMAGLLKVVQMLRHRLVAPNINFTEANPRIQFGSFSVKTRAGDWGSDLQPRRAGVSSLGVGGTNAHLILEEAPFQEASPSVRNPVLLQWSAASESALDTLGGHLASFVERHPEVSLGDIAATLNQGRRMYAYRRWEVVSHRDQAIKAFKGGTNAPYLGPTSSPGMVWMFPGQGAQYPGMGMALYGYYRKFTEVVDHLSAFVEPELRHAWSEGTPEQLSQTQWSQPSLFILEYALACQMISMGLKPEAMIGHSLGEYVAATLANVFDPEVALRLVTARARLMSQAEPGAMLAVSCAREVLEPLLSSECSLAAVNGPQTCVVSGTFPAIAAMEEELQQRGLVCKRLKTSHAYHSALMEPVLEAFRQEVLAAGPRIPQVPFISNVTGTWITASQAVEPNYWVRHLRHTVLFADGLKTLLTGEPKLLLEMGPGRALSTPARELATEGSVVLNLLPDARQADQTASFFLERLGAIQAQSQPLNLSELYAANRRVALPGHPLQRQRFWIDTHSQPGNSRHADAMVQRLPNTQWCYQPSWLRGERLPLQLDSGLNLGRWLVFVGEDAESAKLLDVLRQNQAEVVRVTQAGEFACLGPDHYQVNPAQSAHFRQILQELARQGREPDNMVFTWDLDNPSPSFETGFYSVFHLAHAFEDCAWERPTRLGFVTRGQVQVTGDERIDPLGAPALGAMAVLPREFLFLRAGVFDIDCQENSGWALGLVDAMSRDRLEGLTAIRGAYRWLPRYERMRPPRDRTGLRSGGHYVINGADSLTAHALANHLAQRWAASVSLVLPTGFPDPATWTTSDLTQLPRSQQRAISQYQALLNQNPKLRFYGLGGQGSSIEQVLRRSEQDLGPIHGLFHLAGTPDSFKVSPLRRTLESECRQLFSAKIAELDALRLALPSGLDFVLLWSSLDPVLGEKGSGPLAAANAYLDRYARRWGAPWLAVGWDRWQVEAVTVDTDSTGSLLFKEEIGPLSKLGMSPEEGLALLEELLASSAEEVLVSTADLEHRGKLITRYARIVADRKNADKLESKHANVPERPLLETNFEPVCDEKEAAVAELFAQTLGISRVGRNDNFFDLGGDSLLFLRLGTDLKKTWTLTCPLPLLFETPTPMEMAHHMAGRAQAAPPPVQKSPVEEREIRRHQFEFSANADIDEKKQLMRETYNAVTRQLNTTEFGEHAIYLTFGYRETDAPVYSPIVLPDPMLNRNCIKLVLETIGDVPLTSSDRVLDVGCGRGGTLAAIHRFYPEMSLTGLDLSPEAVAFNQRTHTFPSVRFVEGDAENLPFADGQFTAVTNVESSHSYPNLNAFYREVYRVLAPGGYFLYTDLFPMALYEECKAYLRSLGFDILRDRDITRNVLKSCDEIGHTHLETFRSGNDLEAMGNFLGVPGSKVYNDMEEGYSAYTILKLRKREA